MNETQKKILELSAKKDISIMSLRQIAKEIGEKYPQKISYNIDLLIESGKIDVILRKQNTSKRLVYKNLRQAAKCLEIVESLIRSEYFSTQDLGYFTVEMFDVRHKLEDVVLALSEPTEEEKNLFADEAAIEDDSTHKGSEQ